MFSSGLVGSFRARILFGSGSGLIFLDELRCTGNETRLTDCPASDPGLHDCTHADDIGLICNRKYVAMAILLHVIASYTYNIITIL